MKNQIYKLPTYEEALEIVKRCGELMFYENVSYVDGYKVSTFNYRLAKYNDFIDNDAFELRGLCFVFNLDGTVYKRFILMKKFFNLNQVAETQLSLIENIPFKEVTNKADGSIINFIQLPNGRILAKSKMAVDNDQSILAMEVYNKNESIQKVVKYCLDNNIVAIFELVSPKNKVVLQYYTTDLILLRLRSEITGEYLDVDSLGDLLNGVTLIEKLPYNSWEEILSLVDTAKHIEGWVAELENGMFVKKKCIWYENLHNIVTETVHREDFLIRMILEEKIDDIIALLDAEDIEVRSSIDCVIEKVQSYLIKTNGSVNELLNKFNTFYNGSKKDFAIAERKNKSFAYACSVLSGKDQYQTIVEDLKKKTTRLEMARTFLETGEIK